DAIDRTPAQWQGQDEVDGAEVRMNANTNRATYKGVEIGAEVPLPAGALLFGQGAWIQGETEADGETEPARRSPPLTATAGVRWKSDWNALRLSFYARGATTQDRLNGDDRKDLRICADPDNPGQTLGDACTGTPGWTTLHATVGMDVPAVEGLHLNLHADNLLDTRYRYHGSGFDAPGFNAKLSAHYDF
ncbi:MAG: TonB-dependent receptor, partial [Myxococcota bacterium]|nr:TonB-dependent receptor [Myxococcota bacterium]